MMSGEQLCHVRTITDRGVRIADVKGMMPSKPAWPMFTDVRTKGGNFPSLTRKVGYPWFGLLVESFIANCVVGNEITPVSMALNRALHNMWQYSELLAVGNSGKMRKKPLSHQAASELVKANIEYFQGIAKFARSVFPTGSGVRVGVEWTFGGIQGHPDLVTTDTVWDVKTTGQFGRMRVKTIFQLLSYFSIGRALGNHLLRYVGLVLPAQGRAIRVDLRDWDPTEYLEFIMERVQARIQRTRSLTPLVVSEFLGIVAPRVGAHVNRVRSLLDTFQQHPNQPIQIFLGSNRSSKHAFSDNAMSKALSVVKNFRRASWYTHAPYTLNPAMQPEDDYVFHQLAQQLQTSIALGGNGVVVHMGKKGKTVKSVKQGIDNMRKLVTRVTRAAATPSCPLLLETDSGGSLIDDPSDLANFYLSLPADVRARTAICLDTCHVFVAGYDSIKSLHMFAERGVPVRLIHFNDSAAPFGSKRDCHAAPGKGEIGLKLLTAVGKYAIERGIDLVNE